MPKILDFLVIIPTFRRPVSLRMAIRSAVNQPEVTKKIIVADDCPDGSAAEVVKEFAEVIYLKNPFPSRGWPGRVRNFAFQTARATGIQAHFVHFLDDDDTVPEWHYRTMKEAFDRHPNIGVVFGVMRPFCLLSDDPARREQQERQLRDVQTVRFKAARFPWIYQQFDTVLGLPGVTRWFYTQRAMFGAEMFLCSGGAIRYRHVVELGGFPDIRITQDYWFYTDAIRKFGAVFLRRETAGYGVGDPTAVWNPLGIQGMAKAAHTTEWNQELELRQRKFREAGYLKYYARRWAFRIEDLALRRIVMPACDRLGYFNELHRLTDPDHLAATPHPDKPSNPPAIMFQSRPG